LSSAVRATPNLDSIMTDTKKATAGEGCSAVLAIRLCLVPDQFVVSNLGGLDSKELDCIKHWASSVDHKANCVATVAALDGSDGNGWGLDSKNGQTFKNEKPARWAMINNAIRGNEDFWQFEAWPDPAAKDSRPIVLGESSDDPDALCLCPVGASSGGLGGGTLGEYPKSNPSLFGPSGPCAAFNSCDECSRTHASGASPCCQLDGVTCGEVAAIPNFNQERCVCSGLFIFKSHIWKKNRGCQPGTQCSDCRDDCANAQSYHVSKQSGNGSWITQP